MAITAIPSSLGHTLPWVHSVIAFRDRVTLDRGPKEEGIAVIAYGKIAYKWKSESRLSHGLCSLHGIRIRKEGLSSFYLNIR